MNWYKKIFKISQDTYDYSDNYWKKNVVPDTTNDFDTGDISLIEQPEVDLQERTPETGYDTPETDWEDAAENYYEHHDSVISDVVNEFNNSKPGEVQSWRRVPLPRIKKIWMDFANLGFVRDITGLEMISEIVIENIQKIHVNTILMNHTEIGGDEVLDEMGLHLNESEDWEFNDWCVDENGAWRISDNALSRLTQGALNIAMAKTPEQKLVELDKVFNIVHQRSDIASWFVEGGVSALSELSNQGIE